MIISYPDLIKSHFPNVLTRMSLYERFEITLFVLNTELVAFIIL